MKPGSGDKGARTYGTVRNRYDAWSENRPATTPNDNWTPGGHQQGISMARIIFAAIGVGIGLLLLLLSGFAFWAASSWAALGREPAAIGYVLVGVFLIVAGVGGIAATLHHNFRVLDPNRAPAHH
ncbi:hypothetical protein BH23GEM3_BH23GEM3_17230 [soil metagenome]|nr:hypothetical protein [Gemmatimonadota bacterium]